MHEGSSLVLKRSLVSFSESMSERTMWLLEQDFEPRLWVTPRNRTSLLFRVYVVKDRESIIPQAIESLPHYRNITAREMDIGGCNDTAPSRPVGHRYFFRRVAWEEMGAAVKHTILKSKVAWPNLMATCFRST